MLHHPLSPTILSVVYAVTFVQLLWYVIHKIWIVLFSWPFCKKRPLKTHPGMILVVVISLIPRRHLDPLLMLLLVLPEQYNHLQMTGNQWKFPRPRMQKIESQTYQLSKLTEKPKVFVSNVEKNGGPTISAQHLYL